MKLLQPCVILMLILKLVPSSLLEVQGPLLLGQILKKWRHKASLSSIWMTFCHLGIK